MLLVSYPGDHRPQTEYIISVLIQDFLGLDAAPVPGQSREFVISMRGDQERVLRIRADRLFHEGCWRSLSSLPAAPLDVADLVAEGIEAVPGRPASIPVIYGRRLDNGRFFRFSSTTIETGVDIFGSCLFMLTRYEEAVDKTRDRLGRFPAARSLAVRQGFLGRPIVNEYLEVLWSLLHALWPGLERRRRSYRVLLSHDVDHPLTVAGRSPLQVARATARDLMHDPLTAARRLAAFVSSGRRRCSRDPANTFDALARVSESRGLRSAFYFMACDKSDHDDGYSLEHPWVARLIEQLSHRGHEIGLHAGFYACDSERVASEARRLSRALSRCSAGGTLSGLGGRQHYLRWDVDHSWLDWELAGLAYDSSVGFAEAPGFRCGVCFEYQAFDLTSLTRLSLRERPLIVMDQTIIGPEYLGLSAAEATRVVAGLADQCRVYSGDFTLLWHNTNLMYSWQRRLYESLVDAVCGGGPSP